MTGKNLGHSLRSQLLISLIALSFSPLTGAGAAVFVYTDPQRVVTLEFGQESIAIFNVVNLADAALVIEPSQVLIEKADGKDVLGQVFGEKNQEGRIVFAASKLVQPRSSMGADLYGPFKFKGDISGVFVSQGGRVFAMQKVAPAELDSLAARLEKLDMRSRNMAESFRRNAIPDLGRYIPFEKSGDLLRRYEALLGPDGLNSPKILKQTRPTPTEEAAKAGFSGVVEVVVILDKSGNVRNMRFPDPPPHGLGRRVEETVRNGWRFLPATRGGEVLGSECTLKLSFGDAREPEQTPHS